MLPENLKKQELEETERMAKGAGGPFGDFGSYHALLTGKDPRLVSAHAVLDPAYLASYARQAKAILRTAGCPAAPRILDVGCGPGALTDALAGAFAGAEALGVDISTSAIAYAKSRFPACRFAVMAVDEGSVFPGKFDVVHAREFYPFTRTGDLEFQRRHLRLFTDHLSPGGVILLSLVEGRGRVCGNAEALGLRKTTMAHPRLEARLPLGLARLATAAALRALRRPSFSFYLCLAGGLAG